MADRKTGPVKPPVIDLKARSGTARSGRERGAARAETSRAGKAGSTAAARSNGATSPKVEEATRVDATATAGPSAAERTGSGLAPDVGTAARVGQETPPAAEAAPVEGQGQARREHPDADVRRTAAESRRNTAQQTSPPRATSLPPRPPARLAMPWSAISLAALIGAILGTMLTYAAVNLLPLPGTGPGFADPTSRLDAEAKSLDDLSARVASLEAATRDSQARLDTTAAKLDTNVAELRQSIASIPKPQAVDLGPIEDQLKTLQDRIAAVGAGASSADAQALASNIADLQSGLADLKSSVQQLDQHVGSTDSTVAALGSALDDTKKAIAAQNQTLGGTAVSPAIRLPLIVSGLESAIENGRRYADDLASLTALLPDLAVPPAVAQGAATGLPRPDLVAQRFEAAMPQILAGRAAGAGGDWGQDAVDWIKAVLALRPVGEMPGNSPDAITSRLEAAVGRHDFVAAAALLDQLPPAMRGAAGDVGADIETLAAAEQFLSGLRSQTLSSTEAAVPAAGATAAEAPQ